ncbi:MAG: hypothetical protein Q4G66_12085 [bacterium]|nr:hypothetical protein [bacterium]
MKKVAVHAEAPDFTLPDIEGRPVSLSSFRNTVSVYLVLNRGFS